MPRVKYIDEMSKEGELDLGRVRAGDLVRFMADFKKLAGPKGLMQVQKGEVGEVKGCGPESMRVSAPGQRTAAGDAFGEYIEADLDLNEMKMVAILVDSRDPRIGNERITGKLDVGRYVDPGVYNTEHVVQAAAPELVAVEPIDSTTLGQYVEMEAEAMGCPGVDGSSAVTPELEGAAAEFARMFNGVLNYWLQSHQVPGAVEGLADEMSSAAHYAFMDMRGEGTGLWDKWDYLFPKPVLEDLRKALKSHPGSRAAFQRLETALQNAASDACPEDPEDPGDDDEGGGGQKLRRNIERPLSAPESAPRMQAQPPQPMQPMQARLAALEPWELEMFVNAAAARGADPLNQRMVITELVRFARRGGDGLRAARTIAKTSARAWTTFVIGAGLAAPRVVTADAYEFLEQYGWFAPEAFAMAQWAVSAVSHGPDFSKGRVKSPDIKNRGDVLSAFDELIADVEGGPYAPQQELQPSEEGFEYVETMVPGQAPPGIEPDLDKHVKEQVGALRKAREYVAGLDDAAWSQVVAFETRERKPTPAPAPAPEAPRGPMLAPPAPEPELPPEIEPAPMAPEEESELPAVAAGKVPIRWRAPGGGAEKWVYPEVGAKVYIRSIKEHGVIAGFDAPDAVLVETESGRGAYDATDVYLHQRPGDAPPTLVPYDESKAWKTRRKRAPGLQQRSGSCYDPSDGQGDNATGDRTPGDPGRGGEAHPTRAAAGYAGGDPGGRPGFGEVVGARELWDGVVLHLAWAGDGAGSGDGSGDGGQRVALAPLGVKELKEWLKRPEQFAVISAYKMRSKSDNQKGHGQLMAELQRRGYSPGQIRPLRGQYFGEGGQMKAEQSMLILGMGFEEAVEVGRMMGQESIIYKSPEGVVGAYYTDGSGRVNLALSGEDVATGEGAATIRERAPKPEKRGPPAPSDPWSKARGVGFEFPINWDKTFQYKDRPLTPDEARQQLGVTEVSASQLAHLTPEIIERNIREAQAGAEELARRMDAAFRPTTEMLNLRLR